MWSDLPASTILNGFTACHISDGDTVENVDEGGFVDDDILAELMENLAVEEVIDPSSDIDNCDDVNDVNEHELL